MHAYNKAGVMIADNYAEKLKSGTYFYDGKELDVRRHTYVETTGINYEAHNQSGYTYRQDAAEYNGVLFQAITGNDGLEDKVAVYNHLTGSFLSAFSCPISHGSSLCFSYEKYSSDDEFPLLYCTVESPTILVRVLRMTRNSGTLVRTLTLVDDPLVRNIVVSVDNDNHKMITSWNKGGHYADISIAKCHVITVWDLDTLEPTGNENEYRPKLVDQFEVPFIACQQGCCFLNGIMYILSSGDATFRSRYNLHTAWIYALDPYARRYTAILKSFTSSTAEAENEGIIARYNNDTGKYDLEMIPLRGTSAIIQII